MNHRALARLTLALTASSLIPLVSMQAQDATNSPIPATSPAETNVTAPLAAASATPSAPAPSTQAPQPPQARGEWKRGPGGPGGRGGNPLEGSMKTLARGMRQLSGQITDPAKQADNVALIESLIKASNDSKNFIPESITSAPETEQAGLTEKYKSELTELSEAFAKVEEALKAGDYSSAKSLLGTVNTIKKEGHSQFARD